MPENLPDVPLRGTASAPLDALLAWRAEIHAATLAFSATATDLTVAEFAQSSAKANRDAAIAAYNTAVTRTLNAKARSSIASKRRRTAWESYIRLSAPAHSDTPSPSPSPSTVSGSPAYGGKDMPHASSDARSMPSEYGDIFDGLSVEDAREFDADGMDLA